MNTSLVLLFALSFGLTTPAAAQRSDSLLVEIDNHYQNGLIKGFGRAEIVDTNGKKHLMFVPVKVDGIQQLLSFHRTEEDLRKFGKPAAIISVDKVRSMTVNGLYQEHIVLDGKQTHLLATRVVNGPIELFYAVHQTKEGVTMVPSALPGIGPTMLLGSYERTWYLRRRSGELELIEHEGFAERMSQYFADYPELAETFSSKKKDRPDYDNLVVAVRAYNRHLLQAASASPAIK